MAFIRAWVMLFLIWLLCVWLIFFIRTMSQRQAMAWRKFSRWAAIGALMTLAFAALTIYLF